MNKTEKAEILEKSKIWFKTSIMEQHQVNTNVINLSRPIAKICA